MQKGLIDTHAHLTSRFSNKSIEEVATESKKAGLSGIILASSNFAEAKESVELAQKFPGFLYASVGIHPKKTDPENTKTIVEQIKNLDTLITNYKSLITGVGETGLDFSPAPEGEENRSKEEQIELFKGQINLAIKYNLPLIIHARETVDEVVSILQGVTLEAQNHLRGVFHCYAGGRKRIQKILDLDSSFSHLTSHSPSWYFGFDGNLTYDQGLQNIVQLIPENRLLLETDSPFLTPEPHRGEINTPANLALIAQKVNAIFQKDLSDQIWKNTKRLFRI